MTCDTCGEEMVLLTGKSPLFTARCTKCGRERSGIAESIPVSSPRRVRLFIAWQGGRVTATQVATLRKVLPEVSDRSIREVVATAGKRTTMPLGRFREDLAEELVAKGRAQGLDLRYQIEVDAPDAGEIK